MNVKRYNSDAYTYGSAVHGEMTEDDYGEWVEYDDYVKLMKELTDVKNMLKDALDEIDSLEEALAGPDY